MEEVDLIVSGENYGWNRKEGSFLFDPATADDSFDANPDPALLDPVLEYTHQDGIAVLGGYVYRGSALPAELSGKYLFGDLSRDFLTPGGRLFSGDLTSGLIQELNLNADESPLSSFVKGFGQDEAGEIFVLTSQIIGPAGATGRVLKLVPLSDTEKSIGDSVSGQNGAAFAGFGPPEPGPFSGSLISSGHENVSPFHRGRQRLSDCGGSRRERRGDCEPRSAERRCRPRHPPARRGRDRRHLRRTSYRPARRE